MMKFVKIVHPSLEDYAERANSIATRNNRANLLMLNEADILDENDRNEFSFIMKAVGDQLLHREWEAFASKPNEGINFSASAEPEIISGSTFLWEQNFDSVRVCTAH